MKVWKMIFPFKGVIFRGHEPSQTFENQKSPPFPTAPQPDNFLTVELCLFLDILSKVRQLQHSPKLVPRSLPFTPLMFFSWRAEWRSYGSTDW